MTNMPTYDYHCNDCKKKFSITCSISEHDKKPAKCPKCGSKKVRQEISSFFAVTSHKA
jgi:putative FmdB family regulatory protein